MRLLLQLLPWLCLALVRARRLRRRCFAEFSCPRASRAAAFVLLGVIMWGLGNGVASAFVAMNEYAACCSFRAFAAILWVCARLPRSHVCCSCTALSQWCMSGAVQWAGGGLLAHVQRDLRSGCPDQRGMPFLGASHRFLFLRF